MKTMNIEDELRDAYRCPENWLAQASNVLNSILWFLGSWILTTTVVLGFVFLLIALNIDDSDISELNYQDIQSGLKLLFIFVSGISILFLVGFALPKRIRNVFRNAAENRVKRYQQIRKSMSDQIDLTEKILLKHNLISKENVDSRKSSLKEDRLL